ncbi:MAG: hypothetical protein WBF75_20360 [Pseudonocardiaceae bacterium]
MPDLMSSVDLAEQHVELLPARTVLSLWRADLGGDAGLPGESGSHGADGKSIPGTSWWALLGYDRGSPGS